MPRPGADARSRESQSFRARLRADLAEHLFLPTLQGVANFRQPRGYAHAARHVVGRTFSMTEVHPGATKSLSSRAYGVLSGAIGAIAGISPHVLHHIGPIVGTAVLTGAEGSALFGVIGFVVTLPLLVRLKRRFSTWMAPGVALAFFFGMFIVSTLWIGPAIRGAGPTAPSPVDPHHPAAGLPYRVA